MKVLSYTLEADDPQKPPMGLIVLSVDETIEEDMHRSFRDDPGPLYVSRIPSGDKVTQDSLKAMKGALSTAASLLPSTRRYRVVGYGCTSASAVLGSSTVEAQVQQACPVDHVTNPLRALIARTEDLGLSRLALVSPYIEEVNAPLRDACRDAGLSTDVFGSFAEAEEANVARISAASIINAAVTLGADPAVEGVFLSCTNLRTYDIIDHIQAHIGKPVLSSNQVLA
jgi:maleate isomerase